MNFFLAVVAFHFLEHIVQLWQLYVLQWSRPQCLGLLGLWQPWLVRSELLHYSIAFYMLVGLYIYRPLFKNHWWTTAYYLQAFHHLEHAILMTSGVFWGTPISIGGLWFSRIELHFFYNLIVIIPMAIAFRQRSGVSHHKIPLKKYDRVYGRQIKYIFSNQKY